jgi:hypothetical protein
MRNEKLLDEINSGKVKIFFRLNQLNEITGLKTRALKYRMKEIKSKYGNIPSLLTKEGRCWKIHYTIIDEFFPKKNRKETNIYTYNWQNIVTWNPIENYETAYHQELINLIKQQLPDNRILYAIEDDNRMVKHVHFITDANKDILDIVVGRTLKLFLSHRIGAREKKEYHLEINKIYNKYCVVSYLRKAPLSSGII